MSERAGWGAKHAVVVVLAAVVGLAVGGLPARDEARALQTKVELLEGRECDRQVGFELAEMLRGGRLSDVDSRRPERPETPPEPAAEPAPDDDAPSTDDAIVVEFGDDDGDNAADGLQSIEAMRDAMELRQVQSRAALREQTGASDEQMETVDDIVGDMNDELRGLADDFADMIGDGGEPDRREMMLFAADALDVFIGTEDAILDTFDDEQLAQLDDEAHDPFSFVDGSVIEALQELDE